jgi:hypothetical protein
MTSRHHAVGRAGAAAAVLLVCGSCASGRSCDRTPPEGSGCADLQVDGTAYDEWRPFHGPRVLQELGDGTYPACNSADACDRDGLGDHGATDVWRLEGVDPARALVGLREGTSTRVVFVAVGVEPETISPAAG